MYSLQDLLDINSGVLLSYLENKFSQFKSVFVKFVLVKTKNVCFLLMNEWTFALIVRLSIIETASGLLLLVRDATGREKRRNLLITDSVIYSTAILMKSNV